MIQAAKSNGDGLRLSDGGSGLSEAAQTHSLALAAAQGIVEQHYGWIEARAELASEKEFNIFLPGPSEGASAELTYAMMPGLRGCSERLLLVEEDQGLRRFVTLLLQRLGYVVQETATISDALRLWQENRGAFDLLLVDLSGSRENQGWELLDQLRKEKPNLGALVMASSKEPSDRPRLLSGRTRLLTKPFVPEALAQLIRECLSVQ
jgi:CheY-like chemotaxis protein